MEEKTEPFVLHHSILAHFDGGKFCISVKSIRSVTRWSATRNWYTCVWIHIFCTNCNACGKFSRFGNWAKHTKYKKMGVVKRWLCQIEIEIACERDAIWLSFLFFCVHKFQKIGIKSWHLYTYTYRIVVTGKANLCYIHATARLFNGSILRKQQRTDDDEKSTKQTRQTRQRAKKRSVA